MSKDLTDKLIKNTIDYFTKNIERSEKKTLILDISQLVTKEAQEYLNEQLKANLTTKELDLYNQNPIKYGDVNDLQHNFTLTLITNPQIQDYFKGVIASESQYCHTEEIMSKSNVQYMQESVSALKRGIQLDQENIQQIQEVVSRIKKNGNENRPAVQFSSIRCEIVINNTTFDLREYFDNQASQAAKMVSLAQQNKLAVILDIEFKNIFGDQNNINLAYARNNFLSQSNLFMSTIIYQLQKLEVKLENLILCTNIAEQQYKIYCLQNGFIESLNQYKFKQFTQQLAFQTMKIYNQSIPPAVAGVFQKLSFGNRDQQRFDFQFMVQLEQEMDTMTCWGQGIIISYTFLEEVIKAYSYLQRSGPAHVYFNQLINILSNSMLGKFNDDYKIGVKTMQV